LGSVRKKDVTGATVDWFAGAPEFLTYSMMLEAPVDMNGWTTDPDARIPWQSMKSRLDHICRLTRGYRTGELCVLCRV